MARRRREELTPVAGPSLEWRFRWLRRFAVLPASELPAPAALVAAVERIERSPAPLADRLVALERLLAQHGYLADAEVGVAALWRARQRWPRRARQRWPTADPGSGGPR